jgi:hypothetical protein
MEGLDFTQPGALEQYQKDHAGYFDQQTLSDMFARDAMNKGGMDVSNNAQGATTSSTIRITKYGPVLRQRAQEGPGAINTTMAARGAYGSSAADNMIGEMNTNLAADASKANAQYGLDRGNLLGQLAQGADTSSGRQSANARDWTSTFGNLAQGADQAGLSRVIGGANVAGMAQGARRHGGRTFHNNMEMGNALSGIMGQDYGNMFSNDQNSS